MSPESAFTPAWYKEALHDVVNNKSHYVAVRLFRGGSIIIIIVFIVTYVTATLVLGRLQIGHGGERKGKVRSETTAEKRAKGNARGKQLDRSGVCSSRLRLSLNEVFPRSPTLSLWESFVGLRTSAVPLIEFQVRVGGQDVTELKAKKVVGSDSFGGFVLRLRFFAVLVLTFCCELPWEL